MKKNEKKIGEMFHHCHHLWYEVLLWQHSLLNTFGISKYIISQTTYTFYELLFEKGMYFFYQQENVVTLQGICVSFFYGSVGKKSNEYVSRLHIIIDTYIKFVHF